MLPLFHPRTRSTSRSIFSFAMALAMAGCAGTSMTVEEADAALRAVHPNDEVLITLLDGGTVRAKANQHRWTDTVGAFQVRGTRRPRAGSRSTDSYTGWIKASDVDSVQTIGSVATPVKVLHLKDGSLLYAASADFVELPPEPNSGFWCKGAYLRANDDGIFGSDSTFTGTIDLTGVRSVEVVDRDMRAASHVLQGLGMIAAIPLLVGAGTILFWLWSR